VNNNNDQQPTTTTKTTTTTSCSHQITKAGANTIDTNNTKNTNNTPKEQGQLISQIACFEL